MNQRMSETGSENELAVILSYYESDFVYDIVKEHIRQIRTMGISNINRIPNVVNAWEANFKAILDTYGSDSAAQINSVREATYQEVINSICNAYSLNFTEADVDLYTAASVLYDFFVCNLANNISLFFAKFIYRNCGEIYDSMGLSEMKKNKDSSTLYGKRMYKDIKLAVINANITKVVMSVCDSMEFDLPSIILSICDKREIAEYILSLISDKENFFYVIIKPLINSNLAEYITDIRFKIQDFALVHDQFVPYDASKQDEEQDITGNEDE